MVTTHTYDALEAALKCVDTEVYEGDDEGSGSLLHAY